MRLAKIMTPVAPVKEFDRFFDRFLNTPAWPTTPRPSGAEMLWEPALDLSETPKEFTVRLEIPGVARDDLDVNLDGNLLTLSGKRELNRHEKNEDYLWEERIEGRFVRTLRLPGAVDEAKIEANYNNGILVVCLPKAEQPVKNKISIK